MNLLRLSLPAALLLATPVLAACTENADAGGGRPARDRGHLHRRRAATCPPRRRPPARCASTSPTPAREVTEFYLLGEDGLRIVGEVENIGPSLDRQLVVTAPEGNYVTACKPGMKGEGIRADFTVTASDEEVEVSADDQELVDQATANYKAYVQDQSDQLVVKTQEFVDLYKSGDDDAARALYADARVHWERIETVAESFGDLDPMMDAREADLEPGQKWTGWHLIEKDLWPQRAEDYTAADPQQRATYADDLMTEHHHPRHPDRRARPSPSTRSPTAPAACSRRSPPAR